ncbi:MAG: transporter substrate-binding domain-containing protein [Pseudomonadota bacterium]
MPYFSLLKILGAHLFHYLIQFHRQVKLALKKFWRMAWMPLALGICPASSIFAADLTAYTEPWLPYNYTEGNEIKGISTDVLRAACKLAKLSCEIQIVPWARAYKTVTNTPNSIIYTTARNPSRENQFVWVGPILPRTTWAYGKTGMKAEIHSIKDLGNARIGVVRDEASLADLLAVGVPPSSFVELNSNNDVLRMMMLEKINVVVETEIGMAWSLKSAGIASSAVTKLMKINDGGAYYFALNLQSDPIIVAKLQAGIDKLRREGKIDTIVLQYTKQIN